MCIYIYIHTHTFYKLLSALAQRASSARAGHARVPECAPLELLIPDTLTRVQTFFLYQSTYCTPLQVFPDSVQLSPPARTLAAPGAAPASNSDGDSPILSYLYRPATGCQVPCVYIYLYLCG